MQYTTVFIEKYIKPNDQTPLVQAIDTMIKGQVQFIVFTSVYQITSLMNVVRAQEKEAAFRRALSRVVICCMDTHCSNRLSQEQLFVDIENSSNLSKEFENQIAQIGPHLLKKKLKRADLSWVRMEKANRYLTNDKTSYNSPFLKACRLEPNETIPIWLMRQAGRYMAEYQIVRKKASFKEMCKNPELAADVTITAVERLNVDAAIIFSDILPIIEPMGLELEYVEGQGPVISNPIKDEGDIKNLKSFEVTSDLRFVMEAISLTRKSMHSRIPLIGFAGAPFTLASYMIEGGSSKEFKKTKELMIKNTDAWNQLLEKITNDTIEYLNAQIEAGCQAVQVFDSWVCHLTPEEYKNFVLPHSQKLIQSLKKGTPVIHFGSFTEKLLPYQQQAGGDVLSLYVNVDMETAWNDFGNQVAIQGNFDPDLLFKKPIEFLPQVKKMLQAVGSRPGYIFNLGHGIKVGTPVDHVMALVDYVHEWKM